jgi:VWFA-related protein
MMAALVRWAGFAVLAVLIGVSISPLYAFTVEVNNPVGDVRVSIGTSPRFRIQGIGANRKVTREDTEITRTDERLIVHCAPDDDEPIDLDILIPIGFSVDITTTAGAIEITGMVRGARLSTETGSFKLAVPWRATRIQIDSEHKPLEVFAPRARFTESDIQITTERAIWRLRDRIPLQQVIYGRVRARAQSPGEVRLIDQPIPDDSPIKLPWQSLEVLDEILQPNKRPKHRPQPKQLDPAPLSQSSSPEDSTVFRSDVRMVNLVVTATDAEGHPAGGLSHGDFTVIEEGREQEVSFAGSDDVPFNLAILLDLSGSTKPDRQAMRVATKRFVALARPNDRVAVYALAGDVFHVVAPLSGDHESLLDTLDKLPEVSGGSPLYDSVALAYAEELHDHPGERNALIVISDGIDNQVSKQADAPSTIKFKQLIKAAAEMNALIYPVFLRSGERFGRKWSKKGRERMQQLADVSNGRLFAAISIQDLDPVFPLIEAELRGVYSVAYYPSNQDFDGGWRNVKVQVSRPGIAIQARPGYYAR